MLMSHGRYILVIGLPAIAALVLQCFMHSANAQTTMAMYNDPQGRFSVSYPSSWIATPATNRFESTLLKVQDPALSNSMSITLISTTETDPEPGARTVATAGSYAYTLFQPVECSKYHIDGQKTCSFILTKSADVSLGTPGRVVMGVDSYANGHMYALTFGSDFDGFDAALPAYEQMINSFRGSIAGEGTQSIAPSNNQNVLH